MIADNDAVFRRNCIAIGLAIAFYGAGSGTVFYACLGFWICTLSFLLL